MKVVFRFVILLVAVFFLQVDQVCPSVVKGTVIATAQGEKCVENLKVGDEVFGVDLGAQKIVKSLVTAISSRSSKEMVVLTTTREEVVVAAPDQQFFDPAAQEWVLASDFSLTNHLVDSKGNPVSCREVVRCNADEEICTVYDISTSAPHTFFVTKSQFLTHNFLPIAVGISFAFGETLASIAIADAFVGIGALIFGATGIALNKKQAVRDLEKSLKNPLDNEDTQKHILQEKHKWPELVPDPKNNWDKVVEIITTVVATGVHEPHHRPNVYTATATIANKIVQVRYWVENSAKVISDAWVR